MSQNPVHRRNPRKTLDDLMQGIVEPLHSQMQRPHITGRSHLNHGREHQERELQKKPRRGQSADPAITNSGSN
jgi:hypothetical protein